MNGHECYIIGAGDFFGLREMPDDSDYVIAADAGFEYCCKNCIIPDLVLGDFDSLGKAPKHPNVMQPALRKMKPSLRAKSLPTSSTQTATI